MPSAYITGVAESPLGEVEDQSELSMAALAVQEALAEAGPRRHDVDGVFTPSMGDEPSVQLGEYLGIVPRFCDTTDIGGASFEAHVHHAALAIENGRCNVAVIAYASRQRTRRNRPRAFGDEASWIAQFETPHG